MTLPPRDWPLCAHSSAVRLGATDWHVQRLGSGNARKLLFLHGTGASSHTWRDVLPRLADHYDCLAPDFPGHGFSQTALTRFGLPDMTGATRDLLDHLSFEPDAIIGHSAGAAVALNLSHQMNGIPVFGISPALSPFGGAAGFVFSAMARLLAATPFAARGFSLFHSNKRAVKQIIAGTGSTLDDTGISLYRRLVADPDHTNGALQMMAHWDLAPLIASLRAHPPTARFWIGSRDRATPPGPLKQVLRDIGSPDLITAPDLGHLLHETHPGETVREIEHSLTLWSLNADAPAPSAQSAN